MRNYSWLWPQVFGISLTTAYQSVSDRYQGDDSPLLITRKMGCPSFITGIMTLKDSRLVYDGDFTDENELIGEFCGTSIPYITRSRTHVIPIHFKTDAGDSASGFTATYMFVNESECYNQYSDKLGSFAPTDSDGFSESGFSCRWVLVGTEGKLVQIYVTELDIQGSDGCHNDYVEVIDDGTSVIFGRYCGTSQPPVITSSSKAVEIRFKSNVNVNGKGFIAYYAETDSTGICGGILTEPTGNIFSLNRGGDSVYQHELDCRWLIIADKGSIVELKFHSFDVEKHDLCRYDYVLIYDGVSSDENDLLGRFCGQTIPIPLNSSGNVLHVEFKTDKLFALTGFTGSYKHFRVNVTTTQSATDIAEKVTAESTRSDFSSSYTAMITELSIGSDSTATASTSTSDKAGTETPDKRGYTISNSTSAVSTTLILVTKNLTEESLASGASESAGIYSGTSPQGITDTTKAVKGSATEDTTNDVGFSPEAMSKSTGSHTVTSEHGTSDITKTEIKDETEDTTDIGLLESTDGTQLTSLQPIGAAEKSTATNLGQYVSLFACLLRLTEF